MYVHEQPDTWVNAWLIQLPVKLQIKSAWLLPLSNTHTERDPTQLDRRIWKIVIIVLTASAYDCWRLQKYLASFKSRRP